MYHPSYVVENEDKLPSLGLVFDTDVESALRLARKKIPTFPEDTVKCLYSEKDILALMDRILKERPKHLAFDYETTGLKPHAKGHRIVCCAVAWAAHEAWAFPLHPSVFSAWRRVLRERSIKKIAANMKFEDSWSKTILGVEVRGWSHDTMLAAHILDNRGHISGLKFQTYVNFGIPPWDGSVSPFLKSLDDKNGNSFNRVDRVPIQKLLTYCGLDAMYEYRLALKQMRSIDVC
jgi:DNA polymerase I-like protein with 3'-5' exonuclease and polymerase domains